MANDYGYSVVILRKKSAMRCLRIYDMMERRVTDFFIIALQRIILLQKLEQFYNLGHIFKKIEDICISRMKLGPYLDDGTTAIHFTNF